MVTEEALGRCRQSVKLAKFVELRNCIGRALEFVQFRHRKRMTYTARLVNVDDAKRNPMIMFPIFL
jgi:hypothetical protein